MFGWLWKLVIEPLGFGKNVTVLEAAICESATVRPSFSARASINPTFQGGANIRPSYAAEAAVKGC